VDDVGGAIQDKMVYVMRFVADDCEDLWAVRERIVNQFGIYTCIAEPVDDELRARPLASKRIL